MHHTCNMYQRGIMTETRKRIRNINHATYSALIPDLVAVFSSFPYLGCQRSTRSPSRRPAEGCQNERTARGELAGSHVAASAFKYKTKACVIFLTTMMALSFFKTQWWTFLTYSFKTLAIFQLYPCFMLLQCFVTITVAWPRLIMKSSKNLSN